MILRRVDVTPLLSGLAASVCEVGSRAMSALIPAGVLQRNIRGTTVPRLERARDGRTTRASACADRVALPRGCSRRPFSYHPQADADGGRPAHLVSAHVGEFRRRHVALLPC